MLLLTIIHMVQPYAPVRVANLYTRNTVI